MCIKCELESGSKLDMRIFYLLRSVLVIIFDGMNDKLELPKAIQIHSMARKVQICVEC